MLLLSTKILRYSQNGSVLKEEKCDLPDRGANKDPNMRCRFLAIHSFIYTDMKVSHTIAMIASLLRICSQEVCLPKVASSSTPSLIIENQPDLEILNS